MTEQFRKMEFYSLPAVDENVQREQKDSVNMKANEIKIIEDLSLNAWPSHQMQLYDGWILRFSYFYTHRTNCVEQIGSSQLPLAEKIAFCEEAYKRWKTPAIFKITPLSLPVLDGELEQRSYEKQNITSVMCRDLPESPLDDWTPSPSGPFTAFHMRDMTVQDRIPDEWIDALFSIKGNATVKHLKIVPSMYAAIPKDVRCVSIRRDKQIVATGLGILDRDYIGIYAIHVRDDFRRQGMARRICETLLAEGVRSGAGKAYLQVVADNEPAVQLYRSLGFTDAYRYWFRVKTME